MKQPLKRFVVVLSLVVGAALFLSACDITVTPAPTPQTPDETARVSSDPDSAVSSKNLARGASWLYKIEVPSSVPDNSDVVYLELNKNLDIRVMDANRRLIASSSSYQYFGRGNAGLTSAAGSSSTGVDAQAITTNVTCRGSCVILRTDAQSTFYLRVTNNSSSSVNFDLFAFGDRYKDPFEPDNNSRTGAPTLNVGASFTENGALETIGDVDYWYVNANGVVALDAPDGRMGIRAERQNASGTVLGTYQDGDQINVNAGEYLKVYSGLDRAGASSASIYYLSNP